MKQKDSNLNKRFKSNAIYSRLFPWHGNMLYMLSYSTNFLKVMVEDAIEMGVVDEGYGCQKCLHFQNNSCPWNFDYKDTDYAYDCIDYSTQELERLYKHCDDCDKVVTCILHLNGKNPNIIGCKKIDV